MSLLVFPTFRHGEMWEPYMCFAFEQNNFRRYVAPGEKLHAQRLYLRITLGSSQVVGDIVPPAER